MSSQQSAGADEGDESPERSGTVRISVEDRLQLGDRLRGYALSYYARRWWEDAAGEVPAPDADNPATAEAVRRQVIFAVCALESWFFEWVRDEILDDANGAAVLFAEGGREGVPGRMKRVMCELHARGELATAPGFGESKAWDDLHDLLRDRNGLVHAVASYPRGDVPPEAEEGRPTPTRLIEIAPARPLEIVRGVATLLTGFADSEPPDWMNLPGEKEHV